MSAAPKISEAEFQKQVISLAHLHSWRVAHFRSAPTPGARGWATPTSADGAGFPDLVMLRHHRVIVAELKSQKGRVSETQRDWIDAFALSGVDAWIWRPSDLDLIEREAPVRYRTIVADPPWEYERTGVSFHAPEGGAFTGSGLPYGSMSLGQIADVPVRDLSTRDAHLYLWTTQKYLRDAYWISEAWGFSVSNVLVWCKPPRGWTVGGTFMSTTEFVLFCRRGQLASKTRVERQWFEWPRGEHSAKPEAFLDLVEQVSPGPYLELFARRQRLGWDTWGNEALEHVTMGTG